MEKKSEYFLVFDIIEAVAIDIENEEQDFESDISENFMSFIEPNLFAMLPVEVIDKTIFELYGVANNLRVIVKSEICADDLASDYEDLIKNFYNEPWEYKTGSQSFEFAQLKSSKDVSEILNSSYSLDKLAEKLLKIYVASDF
jgi:hypothetical protein